MALAWLLWRERRICLVCLSSSCPADVGRSGRLRTMSTEMRELAAKRIPEIAAGVAATFGGKIDVNYMHGYPVMVNHEEQTEFAADGERERVG